MTLAGLQNETGINQTTRENLLPKETAIEVK